MAGGAPCGRAAAAGRGEADRRSWLRSGGRAAGLARPPGDTAFYRLQWEPSRYTLTTLSLAHQSRGKIEQSNGLKTGVTASISVLCYSHGKLVKSSE